MTRRALCGKDSGAAESLGGSSRRHLILRNCRRAVAPCGSHVSQHCSDLRVRKLTAPRRHVASVLHAVHRNRAGTAVQYRLDQGGAVNGVDVRIVSEGRVRTAALTRLPMANRAIEKKYRLSIGCRRGPYVSVEGHN